MESGGEPDQSGSDCTKDSMSSADTASISSAAKLKQSADSEQAACSSATAPSIVPTKKTNSNNLNVEIVRSSQQEGSASGTVDSVASQPQYSAPVTLANHHPAVVPQPQIRTVNQQAAPVVVMSCQPISTGTMQLTQNKELMFVPMSQPMMFLSQPPPVVSHLSAAAPHTAFMQPAAPPTNQLNFTSSESTLQQQASVKSEALDAVGKEYTRLDVVEKQTPNESGKESQPAVESKSPVIYACNQCEKTFTTRRSLRRHQQSSHKEKSVAQPAAPPQTTTSTDSAATPNATTTAVQPKCPQCDKTFANQKSLKRHSYNHSSVTLSCQQCNYQTTSRVGYQKHLAMHSGKTFQCNVCSEQFIDFKTMANHRAFKHSDARGYLCEICCEEFKTKMCLNRHTASRHNDNGPPPQCDACGLVIKHRHNLSRHRRMSCKALKDRPQQFSEAAKVIPLPSTDADEFKSNQIVAEALDDLLAAAVGMCSDGRAIRTLDVLKEEWNLTKSAQMEEKQARTNSNVSTAAMQPAASSTHQTDAQQFQIPNGFIASNQVLQIPVNLSTCNGGNSSKEVMGQNVATPNYTTVLIPQPNVVVGNSSGLNKEQAESSDMQQEMPPPNKSSKRGRKRKLNPDGTFVHNKGPKRKTPLELEEPTTVAHVSNSLPVQMQTIQIQQPLSQPHQQFYLQQVPSSHQFVYSAQGLPPGVQLQYAMMPQGQNIQYFAASAVQPGQNIQIPAGVAIASGGTGPVNPSWDNTQQHIYNEVAFGNVLNWSASESTSQVVTPNHHSTHSNNTAADLEINFNQFSPCI